MSDYFITDYDVTIYIDEKCKKNFVVSASSEYLAKMFAETSMLKDTIITIEDMNREGYTNSSLDPKFVQYYLVQIDKNGNRYSILGSREYYYLKNIAEKISLPNTCKIEIIGTDELAETSEDYKSYTTIFTRKL